MIKQHGRSGKAFSSIMAHSLGGKSVSLHSMPVSLSVCVQALLRGQTTSQIALPLFWLLLLVTLCVLNTSSETNMYYGSKPGQAFIRRAVHSRHEPRLYILLLSTTEKRRVMWIYICIFITSPQFSQGPGRRSFESCLHWTRPSPALKFEDTTKYVCTVTVDWHEAKNKSAIKHHEPQVQLKKNPQKL